MEFEGNPEDFAFEIEEVDSDDEEEREQRMLEMETKIKMRNKQRLIHRKTSDEVPLHLKYPRNSEGIVIAKPFDYSDLRKRVKKRGYVFVQNTIHYLATTKLVKNYFRKYGNILRVEVKYNKRDRSKPLIEGFYVEFSSKVKARRCADRCNGKPFSNNFPRPMTLRYLPNFHWGKLEVDEKRTKMKEKYLRAEIEKELRQIREYKKNTEESKKVHHGDSKRKAFQHFQKQFVGNRKSSTNHIDKLDLF